MEKHHLKQLNLYVNTDENEATSSKANMAKEGYNDSTVSSSGNTQGNILQRKISTPPPLPHILDTKTKKLVSNVFKADLTPATANNTEQEKSKTVHTKKPNDSSQLSAPQPPPRQAKTKPNTITSSIRDGKIEKPIRVNHGLPPPPPALSSRWDYRGGQRGLR